MAVNLSTYKLAFDDEFSAAFKQFNGTTGWDTTYPWGARTNSSTGEVQAYMDSTSVADPFSVANGVLTIEAKPTTSATSGAAGGKPYTSGMITTFDTFHATHGYFEMRAEMPAGKGLWPAFWMLPTDMSWPPEVDIFEQLGNQPGQVYQTPHGGPNDGQSTTFNVDTTGWHTYGLEWTASNITWYVDGAATRTIANFTTKPMYLLANLAVGGSGSWPGAPDGTTHWPADMKIDYVRGYIPTTDTSYPALPDPSAPPPPPPPTTNAATIDVNAWGTPFNGVNAHFNLLVDGVKINDATVTGTAHDYVFNTTLSANAAHTVQVQYDNDTASKNADRNLFVNKVTINGHDVAMTDPTVSYDRGKLDGKDVIPGQSGMYWNGALVVHAPAGDFPGTPVPAGAAPAGGGLDPNADMLHHLLAQTGTAPLSSAASEMAHAALSHIDATHAFHLDWAFDHVDHSALSLAA